MVPGWILMTLISKEYRGAWEGQKPFAFRAFR